MVKHCTYTHYIYNTKFNICYTCSTLQVLYNKYSAMLHKWGITGNIYYHQIISIIVNAIIVFVIGFWETDQIVTLGLFHFIGPTNGYIRTLHIHSAFED